MSGKDDKGLTLPAFDLRAEIKHLYTSSVAHKTYLFPKKRQLLVSKQRVTVIHGTTIKMNLEYEEEIVCATYVSFNNSENDDDALVVCLRRAAHIHYPDGRTYNVSFPFFLKNAMAFESGLILEKDQNSSVYLNADVLHSQQLNAAKFLTLVDPIGNFRIVSSSSTSVISPFEELMTFPKSGLNKSSFLCATFNAQENSVNLYHVRSSTRTGKSLGSKGSTSSKRKHSLISTPSHSRVLEDDIDPPNNNVISLNMEKKRTSTLLSDVSSIARMVSEPGFVDNSKSKSKSSDFPILRRDMIFTKVDAFNINVKRSQLGVHGLKYEDQEAIVVVNKSTKEARVYIFKNNMSPKFQSSYVFSCEDCIPLNHKHMNGYLIALKEGRYISLINPFLDIVSPKIDLSSNYPPIKELMSSCDESVSMLGSDDKSYIMDLVLEPTSLFVKQCLSFFKFLSGMKIHETIWMLWRAAMILEESKDEWNAFLITLLSVIYPFHDSYENYKLNDITKHLPKARHLHDSFDIKYSFADLIPYIFLSLHLIREETRLYALNRSDLAKVDCLLKQLSIWMGWTDKWRSYYLVDTMNIDDQVRFLSVLILESPPNLLESLTSLFTNKIINFLTFSQLVEESDGVDMIITPRTHHILNLFEILLSNYYGPSHVVDMMCEYGISMSDLETYPPGVYLPLKEAISICQENPEFHWNSKTLELVGRKDLSMFLSNTSSRSLSRSLDPSVKDIESLLFNVLDKNEQLTPWDGQAEADRISITKLIFDYDRRYFEITTLLHQTKPQTATMNVPTDGLSEYELIVLQRELAANVAMRTLTIPLGRAALFYGGRKPLLTEKFPIPKFNLNTTIAPTMTNIVLSEGAIGEVILDWGYFHNGVSSGLSINPDSKGISGSWIIFNKPPELKSQHAGFLLGLGLNGHLKKLEEWHIYNYLGPKHPLTSVGLLIGMAASMRGTMDNKLTKVLSVHAVALLPQGANDLNVPVMVQTAGLMGIGLLYLETQHRRMSEILLSQITSSVFQNDSERIHESYRLSAGISLGFVNLGKGDDLKGLNDTHVVHRLLSLAISMKDYQSPQELDKSCSGAIFALGFIYLKTENFTIASKLKVPPTEQLLDYIRPDLLLLRCVAKNLVMWNEIGNTIEWVESEIPESTLKKHGGLRTLDSDQLAYLNIMGGTCFSIAIKYASTHNIQARDTLLHFLDKMVKVVSHTSTNYDQKIAYHSANNIQNVLALCVSVVMAGSGDLESFRRVRFLHNNTTKEKGYGDYMAINMALGFLFLGGGQYAFGSSNFAIASLVASLYPIFPHSAPENEVLLQALRHFWALSVEPRCLIVRDVNTQTPTKIPVTIYLKNGEIKETMAPCLLPSLENIVQISTKSRDHFSVKIDFGLNTSYLEIFKKSLTVFVYKRNNYQLLKWSVSTLLKNENKSLQIQNGEVSVDRDISKLLSLDVFRSFSPIEKQVFLYESSELDDIAASYSGLSVFNIIDNKIDLESMATSPRSVEDLWNLKLIFAFTDKLLSEDSHFIPLEFIDLLKHHVWALSSS